MSTDVLSWLSSGELYCRRREAVGSWWLAEPNLQSRNHKIDKRCKEETVYKSADKEPNKRSSAIVGHHHSRVT